MMLRQAANPARHLSAAAAAAMVRSGMWLDYGTSLVQPDVFDKALAARIGEVENLKIRNCLTTRPRASLEADPEGRHVHYFNIHFSGYDRKRHDEGRCNYLPVNLGEVPDYYRRFIDPADIAIMKATPPDDDGWMNLSASNLWHRAVIERAKLVIIEVTTGNPHVCEDGGRVHLSEVDYLIDGDNVPAPELPNPAATEIDKAVARYIVGEMEIGSCLQIGIGGMPNAVCALLLESGIDDLGVHTEMMTDGIAELYRAGRVSGARKKLNPGKLVYSFALGSKSLYDTLHRNEDMLCCQVDYTNLPSNIMLNPRTVSINSTTQIDLQGQAASESDGNRHISGTGGQLQFVRGAYASEGGKSFLCLPSTYDKRGEPKSRIVFQQTLGNIITTPRTDVMYVVTEYGIVNLKGKSVAERARALISIAHPQFRDDLERQAREAGIIPRNLIF